MSSNNKRKHQSTLDSFLAKRKNVDKKNEPTVNVGEEKSSEAASTSTMRGEPQVSVKFYSIQYLFCMFSLVL